MATGHGGRLRWQTFSGDDVLYQDGLRNVMNWIVDVDEQKWK